MQDDTEGIGCGLYENGQIKRGQKIKFTKDGVIQYAEFTFLNE